MERYEVPARGSSFARLAAVLAMVVGIFASAGTLRAQDEPSVERILSDTEIVRFFTPATGALFALKSTFNASPTSETLLRSDDGGTSWRAVDLPPGPVKKYGRRAVEVDPLDHTVVYATGLEGLYKTDDDAASWRLIWSTADHIGQLAISAADDHLVYASVAPDAEGPQASRLVRSRDGGETWEEMLNAGCSQMSLFPHPTDAARLMAALECGADLPASLYASQDQGASWTPWRAWPKADPGRSSSLSSPLLAGGGSAQPDRFYVAYAARSLPEGLPLYRTDDAGMTWEDELVGPREEVAPPSPKWQGGKFWSYMSELRSDPIDPDRVYVGLRGSYTSLRMSTDGGATWADLGLPHELKNVVAVGLGVDRKNLYVATTTGAFVHGSEGVYRIGLSTP